MEKKDVKILILEDNQLLAVIIKKMLTDFGYNVVGICKTVEVGLQLFRSEKPDLLLVDILLEEELSGIDFVKIIKKETNLPVIYLTSVSDDVTLLNAKQTLPSAILKKPVDREQLKATIEISLFRFAEMSGGLKKLKSANESQGQYISELTETNTHLIAATWRERELKEELQKTKGVIEVQNKKIMDSINYAKRIQEAIIPTKETLDKLLGDYFLFYKPKDLVSGDFPWVYERGNYVYIAVVDCTGHGVPGAMMSLIGALLLNDVVNSQQEDRTPADILDLLHLGVVKTLKQDDPGNKSADGMDVAICRINKLNNEILFSGAHRPLYHLKDGELIQYKGCKFPIGGMHYSGKNTFINHRVKMAEDDSIYFFSDGLPDQFGGPNSSKFGPKRVRDLIVENHKKSMKDLKEVFEENFQEWKAESKQIDDVLLVGIKF